MRGAVVWVGLDDPGTTRAALAQAADADGAALAALLAGWRELDPDGHGVTCTEVLRRLAGAPQGYEVLRTAVLELCPARDGGMPSARSLGNMLRRVRGRVVAGALFEGHHDRNGIMAWCVKKDAGI